MTFDPIRANLEGTARKRWFDVTAILLFAVVVVFTFHMSLYEISIDYMDYQVHTNIAGDFDFGDLHTITSRLAYPLWHILVAIVHQLGVKLEWAAAAVSALCKGLTFLLTYRLVLAASWDQAKRWVVSLITLALMIVTALWIEPVNPLVYKGIGSPNVWHNPTQKAAILAQMMVMPWLCHCWYDFERRVEAGETNVLLPWWKIIVLIILGMGSLACKPTFMQALLPAAFVMYLVELCRRPGEWRYFAQIVLAFLPSAAYFLLQYLYYTGVVVMYTSGVAFGVTLETAWDAIRSALMMNAAPLAAVVVCYRKGLFRDRGLVLALLMVTFSALEVMAFRETGMREGHGNFGWAAYSSSFYLWVVTAGIFLRSFMADVKAGLKGWRKAGYGVTIALAAWHVVSGVYYLNLLIGDRRPF